MHQQTSVPKQGRKQPPIIEENLADLLLNVRQAQAEEQTPALGNVAQSNEDTHEEEPIAAPVRFNDLFKQYLDFETELERLTSRQQAFEHSLFNTSITETPSTAGIRRIADTAIKRLIRQAQTMFAPPGVVLDISEIDALEATGQKRWNYDYDRIDEALPVDLDKLWDYLEATYGGDAGKTLGLRQIANFIVRDFQLNNSESVKRTSSAAVITKRMWSERKDYGQNKGMYEISYGSRDRLNELFNALSSMFEHAEQHELASALKPSRHRITDYSYAFKSRDRVSFPGLDIVMFKETWEWRWSHEMAEVMMVFLGTYATPDSDR